MTTDARQPNQAPQPPVSNRWSSIANGVAMALIALSLLAQCVGFGIVLSGGPSVVSPRVVAASEYLAAAIAPGMLIAFVKFLLMTIRSFRNRQARMAALAYLVVVLFPTIGNIVVMRHVAEYGTPNVADRVEPESDQFLSGRDWAQANKPERGSQCQGSSDFNRGCRSAIHDARHERFLAGREWARQHRPTRPSECKGNTNFAAGCQNYLYEQVDFFGRYVKPKDAKPNDYMAMTITTTAECIEEVNANYEVVVGLERQDGDDHAAAVITRRHWEPERRNCERYDRVADAEIFGSAYGRLRQAVDRMKGGGTIEESERARIEADHAAVTNRRDQSYKTAYLELFEQYRRRLDGSYREPVVEYPAISCDAYRMKIADMAALDRQRSDEMRALRGEDGKFDGIEHARLNKLRIEMLWDWKLYTDGAKANGCSIEVK